MNRLISNSKSRIKKSIIQGFEYHHLATARSNKFLRKHDSERLPMFVLYVDLVGSTTMSSELDPNVFNNIIRIFSQEMSYVIEKFDGFVLKFVGDAVLGYFVDDKKLCVAKNAIECAKTMNQIIQNAINPILDKQHFPKLQIKVSIDFGYCSIVRYGSDKQKSHIDIIGLTLNLAAKMQSFAKPGQIIIGESVYSELSPKLKSCFKKIRTKPGEWKYHELGKIREYSIYSSISN